MKNSSSSFLLMGLLTACTQSQTSSAHAGFAYTALQDSLREGYVLIAIESSKAMDEEEGSLQIPVARLHEIPISGALSRIQKGFTPQDKDLLSTFESERILGVLPSLFQGKSGYLIIREWRVEGQLPYRVSFLVKGERTVKDVTPKKTPECDELRSIIIKKDELTLGCEEFASSLDNGKPYLKKSSFPIPLSGIAPLKGAQAEVKLPQYQSKGLELTLEDGTQPTPMNPQDYQAVRAVPSQTPGGQAPKK